MRTVTANSTLKASAVSEFVNEAIYERLRCRATAILRRETSDHRLEPADLLHEAFLRIARSRAPVQFENESHLFALTTLVMRRILIDRTRGMESNLRKRCVPLESYMQPSTHFGPEAEQVHAALRHLQSCEVRLYCIVKMRYFWGLEIEEVAAALSVSSRTVKRDWAVAREWLRRELERRVAVMQTANGQNTRTA